MKTTSQWEMLQAGKTDMAAYVARPEGEGPWPGVIVLMEIFGVNRHIRSVTDRIASQGYVTVAPNYYHRTTEYLELGYTDEAMAEGREHKDLTTAENLMADVRACLDYLKSRPDVAPPDESRKHRFGCVGFCFGGHVAYLAAMLPEVRATASFYGGGIATMTPGGGPPTVSRTGEISGEIIALFGDEDPLVPLSDVETIKTALAENGVNHEVVVYPGTGHGFFCDARESYHPEAAADAWDRVTDLFARNLKA